MKRLVRTTNLEMRARSELQPSAQVPDDILLVRAALPSPELNRSFYTGVGADCYWLDRLPWSWSQWMAWLSRPEVETWVAHQAGTPVAYFELEAQGDDTVEIAYFGVLPHFAGKGLGAYLLTQATDRAWRMRPGIRRVWVHTCTLDHPAALRNYLSRGFKIFDETEAEVDLPEAPPEPWPAAERPR